MENAGNGLLNKITPWKTYMNPLELINGVSLPSNCKNSMALLGEQASNVDRGFFNKNLDIIII